MAVARVLGAPVDPDAVLMAAGLDSLGSVELVAELEKLGKIDIPGENVPRRVCSAAYPASSARSQCGRMQILHSGCALCSAWSRVPARPRPTAAASLRLLRVHGGCVSTRWLAARLPPRGARTCTDIAPRPGRAADRLLLTHPSVNALASYLTTRTTATRVHGMTVLGWSLATISWLVGGSHSFRWRCEPPPSKSPARGRSDTNPPPGCPGAGRARPLRRPPAHPFPAPPARLPSRPSRRRPARPPPSTHLSSPQPPNFLGSPPRALAVLVLALAMAIRTGSVSSAAIQAELASLFGAPPALRRPGAHSRRRCTARASPAGAPALTPVPPGQRPSPRSHPSPQGRPQRCPRTRSGRRRCPWSSS